MVWAYLHDMRIQTAVSKTKWYGHHKMTEPIYKAHRFHIVLRESVQFQLSFILDSICNYIYAISDKTFCNKSSYLHIFVSNQGHHWFIQWLVACLARRQNLSQHWFITKWTLRNTFQLNLNLHKQVLFMKFDWKYHIDSLVQDCRNSIANTMELRQSWWLSARLQ